MQSPPLNHSQTPTQVWAGIWVDAPVQGKKGRFTEVFHVIWRREWDSNTSFYSSSFGILEISLKRASTGNSPYESATDLAP